MVKVNEYFGGQVKSLTINSLDGRETVGVMETGDYEFGTEGKERMNVISGSMTVKLPGKNDWQVFSEDSKFEVPANSKFQVKVIADAAYLCEYL
ncbi:MAG: pyrimidine/purine nucleoside phosphorylase [Candidatus Margulisiibacteriota bacterium]